jgi:hypothetical protein
MLDVNWGDLISYYGEDRKTQSILIYNRDSRPLQPHASPTPDQETGSRGKFGWGGRIRTFTIHINSVVSYRLDHAPAVLPTFGRTNKVGSAAWARRRVFLR